jgi:hypothetical protein
MKRVCHALFIFCVILPLFLYSCPVSAVDEAAIWSKVDLPASEKTGGWILAGATVIKCMTQASDGTLYCYTKPASTPYTLFKSEDGGQTWSYTGGVKDAIVDIEVSLENTDVIFYATTSTVYKSVDGAKSFSSLPDFPGGAGCGNIYITAIDAIYTSGRYLLVVATADTDTGEYGGVYLYDETDSDPFTDWEDTDIGSCDVYDVVFSPQPVVGQYHLAAAVNDEAISTVSIRIGDTAWGSLIGDTVLPPDTLSGAKIAFPDNYGKSQQDFILFAGLNTGMDTGDAYIIYGGVSPAASSFVDMNAGRPSGWDNVDINSIAVTGDSRSATVIVGAADTSMVYFSIDGGARWSKSKKPPTGLSNTGIVFSSNYLTSARIFTITDGTECGFSVSTDYGLTWDQVSLLDTQISALIDFAVSPKFDSDGTLFVLTYGNSQQSLWRSESAGLYWSRIFSSTIPGVTGLDCVKLSPEYGTGTRVVFLTGTSGSGPVLWKSEDNGASFSNPRVSYDPETGTPFEIMQCVAVDDNILLLGTFDGTNSLIYITKDGGWSFEPKAVAGTAILNSLSISPSFDEDNTILAGNRAGWIFISEDGGVSFETLPFDTSEAPLTDSVSVTFDRNFMANRKVYAASYTADTGIFRFDIDSSAGWEDIDGTLPDGATVNQVCMSSGGVLYALNNKAGSGIERSLSPSSQSPVFETMTRGLTNTARLSNLIVSGNRIWAMDTYNKLLMTLIDTLTVPVGLDSPPDGASGLETTGVRLDWVATDGATTYEWQCDTDTEFTTVPTGLSDTTQSSSARLSDLEPATTYYWRVRAIGPVLSPWSECRSFTTILGGEILSPQLSSPAAGAVVSSKPDFQWSPIARAEQYELLIGTDNAFTEIAIDKSGTRAIPATAWHCEESLIPETTYYWKVRASSAISFSAWSNTGVFTTAPAVTTSDVVPSTLKMSNEIAPAQTVITVTLLTTPSAQPPAATTQIIQVPQSTPEWLKWLLFMGGTIIILLLIVIVIMMVMIFRGRN